MNIIVEPESQRFEQSQQKEKDLQDCQQAKRQNSESDIKMEDEKMRNNKKKEQQSSKQNELHIQEESKQNNKKSSGTKLAQEDKNIPSQLC